MPAGRSPTPVRPGGDTATVDADAVESAAGGLEPAGGRAGGGGPGGGGGGGGGGRSGEGAGEAVPSSTALVAPPSRSRTTDPGMPAAGGAWELATSRLSAEEPPATGAGET